MNNIIPSLDPVTVKDKVISLLTYDFPLNAKQIKNKIKKQYSTDISYQAVHKAIQELLNKKILTRMGNSYLVNLDWINLINKFSEQLYLNYSKVKKYNLNILNELKNDGDVITLEFNSISELDNYFIDIMEHFHNILDDSEKITMHYKHNWWPMLYSKKEHEINQKKRTNKRFYCLCGSDTYLDRWCCDFENRIGMNLKICKDVAQNWDLHVYNDLIVQFHIDKKIMNKLDEFFSKINSIENLNLKELIDILNSEGMIKVIITKNKLIADSIKEDTLKRFKICSG